MSTAGTSFLVRMLVLANVCSILLVSIGFYSGMLYLDMSGIGGIVEEPTIPNLIPPWRASQKTLKTMAFIMESAGDTYIPYGGVYAKNLVRNLNNQLQMELRQNSTLGHDHTFNFANCLTCAAVGEGIWVSAISQVDGTIAAAVAVVKPDDSVNLQHVSVNSARERWKSIDLGLPYTCEEKKLKDFLQRLSSSVSSISYQVRVRLIVATQYPCTHVVTVPELEDMSGLRERNVKRASVSRNHLVDKANIIKVGSSPSKVELINALHEAESELPENSLLIVLDINTEIDKTFFWNSMAFATSGVCAYFPIPWSKFNPANVALVEEFTDGPLPQFSAHRGQWQTRSFGVYAMGRSDAHLMKWADNGFVNRGEEVDHFSEVSQQLHVIRMRDPGLIEIWQRKNCSYDIFLPRSALAACIDEEAHAEGSVLASFLKMRHSKDGKLFATFKRKLVGE